MHGRHAGKLGCTLEAFMCLVELSHHYTLDEETYPRLLHKNEEDIFAFIHTSDPTKVRIVERERNEGEAQLLDTTIGRTISLLLVAPDHAESELEASVERLFDEGGSGNQTEQEDSTRGKRKSATVDAGRASNIPKKPREDHGTPSGTSVGGESWSALRRLLVGAMLNAKVGVATIPTLPFMTAYVSTTLEHEGGDHTDSMAELNLHTIVAPSSVPIMITFATITSTVDPTLVAKEILVDPFPFGAGSSSASGTDPTTGVFSDLTGSDFLSVTNRSRLDDSRVCREMVDEFAPPKFFASVCGMEHDQLFTKFSVEVARQMSLSAEVRMRAEYNVKEKMRLKSVVQRQAELLKVREGEIENLKAQLLLREAEDTEAIRLRAEASNFEAVGKSIWDETNALKERNAILEKERDALDVKVTKLEVAVVSKERELTDLNALVTSVKSCNDDLADWVHELEISSSGLQEKVTMYENYMDQLEKFQDDRMKYLSALGAAIGKDIEKGMQDGLSARITHGKEGRVLTDVDAHNPSAEVDYISALQ
nr:hypothetical protein [Tanacetum cinerariifolium]